MTQRWRTAFRNNPEQAVADLFDGQADLEPGSRLNIPEWLSQAFADLPEQQEDHKRLDAALLQWLTTQQQDYAVQVKRHGFSVYAKRLCDALLAVHLLDLPETQAHIRRNLNAWLDWLTPLRLAPDHDPALECWRVLTRRQTDAVLAPAWLRLADDPRTEYFSVALIGLQRIPNLGDPHQKQALMLFALFRHAIQYSSLKEAHAFFNRCFTALRALYPAEPSYWEILLEVAQKTFQTEAKHFIAKELLHALGMEVKAKTARLPRRIPSFQPANEDNLDLLFSDICSKGHQGEILAQRLFTYLGQNYRYAEATGDSHWFVRTLCVQGAQLLKRHVLTPEILGQLNRLTEQALVWAPMNPYVFMFWANVLAHQQQWAAYEWVLMETARLFPGHEASRIELARLLMLRGEDLSAEGWLRETVERHPKHEPSRVELARLLIRRGADHWGEAERRLREVVDRNPHHEPSRLELSRLLSRLGEARWAEAEGWLREMVERHPFDEQSRIVLTRLWAKQGKFQQATEMLSQFMIRNPQNILARQWLEKLQANAEGTSNPQDWDEPPPAFNFGPTELPSPPTAAETIAQDANESPLFEGLKHRARLQAEFNRARAAAASNSAMVTTLIDAEATQGDALASLYRQWLKPEDRIEPPPHAWAAHACRLFQADAPVADWKQLEHSFPEHRMLTQFLRLLTPMEDDERYEKARHWKRYYIGREGRQSLTPLQLFLLDTLDRPPTPDTTLAVLTSAALAPPPFAALFADQSAKG